MKSKNFIELGDAWGNFALSHARQNHKNRMVKGFFNIGVMRKINIRKTVAVILVAINTPLPTMSPVTNPILYNKVINFNTDKLMRKKNLWLVNL